MIIRDVKFRPVNPFFFEAITYCAKTVSEIDTVISNRATAFMSECGNSSFGGLGSRKQRPHFTDAHRAKLHVVIARDACAVGNP